MAIPEKARHLIKQWSEAIELEGLMFDEDGVIEILLGDDLHLSLGVDEAGEAILLCAELLPDASALPNGVLRRILITNASQHAKNGPTYAISPGSGSLVLQKSVSIQDVHYADFEAALLEFIEAFDKTKARLRTLTPDPDAFEGATAPDFDQPEESIVFIRA
jgi:hypothetical protein